MDTGVPVPFHGWLKVYFRNSEIGIHLNCDVVRSSENLMKNGL